MTTIFSGENRLLILAGQGRHPPSALAAIAIVFGILVLALIPSQALARIVVRLLPVGIQSSHGPILLVIMFLPIYLGLWIYLRLFSRRPFWTVGLERRHAFRRVFRGVLVAGLMMAVTAGLSIAAGASHAPGSLQTMGLRALGVGLLSLLAYFVQGPAEEVLFRGWLLPVTGARYRPWIGVLISSLTFSAAHGLNPAITLLGYLNLFLFGVFAAVYALAEGGLWGICAWHAVWNWSMGDLLGFAVDGAPHSGLLSSVRDTGADIITGGAFGPEGGLACTAVFLIAMGVIIVRSHSSPEGRLTVTD